MEIRKGQGVLGKTALSFFYLGTEQSRGWGAPWPAALGGAAAAEERGEMERRPRGIDSRPHLEWRRPEAACPWRWAEVAGDGSGDGATGKGRRLKVAAGVCGARGRRKGPIYRPGEVGRRGRGWLPAGGSSAAINGVGAVWASRSGVVALR